MKQPYIQFNHVIKEYVTGGVVTRANNDINFTINKGEFVVILGPSGAGKSTTVNILGGMDYPTSGEVIVDGVDISKLNAKEQTLFRRHNIGFVFQSYNLIPNLTAKENVELMIEISKSKQDPMTVLRETGLESRANNFPSQLSGGEQQRVSIARAISSSPNLLLCDEPTGALDSHTGQLILELLIETTRQSNTTTVVITHNREIAKLADRVIEIRDGHVASETLNDAPMQASEISW